MTTSVIRKKLHSFIADADDKKIKGMYLLFQDEMENNKTFNLSEEQKAFLDKEKQAHLEGKGKSYTWEESKKLIRTKKSNA